MPSLTYRLSVTLPLEQFILHLIVHKPNQRNVQICKVPHPVTRELMTDRRQEESLATLRISHHAHAQRRVAPLLNFQRRALRARCGQKSVRAPSASQRVCRAVCGRNAHQTDRRARAASAQRASDKPSAPESRGREEAARGAGGKREIRNREQHSWIYERLPGAPTGFTNNR